MHVLSLAWIAVVPEPVMIREESGVPDVGQAPR